MSEEGDGLPVVRVKFACANVEEFRRKFEPNLLAKGMLARTPQMHEVGKRVMLRLELQDGSLGVDEEAVVQALEWTGGKQAMRLHLARARNPTAPAPQPVAAAPAAPSAGPQAVALPAPAPPPRLATGTAIPAVTDWAAKAPEKPPERVRTDTEATRAMSLDELLNALPPTAKPKLTPSGEIPRLTPAGGVPHLNGTSARPAGALVGGGFNPVPPAPAPANAMPLAPPISAPPPPSAPDPTPVQAYEPPPEADSPPPETYAPPAMGLPAEVTTFPPANPAPPSSALPPPISEGEPPPSVRPMTPMYPMQAVASPPPPEPAPAMDSASPPEPVPEEQNGLIMSAADFKASLTGEITVRSPTASSNAEESLQPGSEPGADLAGPTVFNTAHETTTASNATVAVPGLANEVEAAKRRGPGRAIATFILFLAALSGAGAYLWRTGQLEEYAPAIAAYLPPSPAAVAQPTPPPAPTTAEAPKPPPTTAEAPKPPAPTEAAPAPTAEAPKPPAPTEAAPAPTAEAPKPPAEAPKPPDTAAAPEEAPKPPAPAAEGPEIKLIITTEPPGAKVLANGEQVGVSPMELPWEQGKPIKLRFTKPGFKPANRNFTPKATGTLPVTLAPAGAQPDELKDVY